MRHFLALFIATLGLSSSLQASSLTIHNTIIDDAVYADFEFSQIYLSYPGNIVPGATTNGIEVVFFNHVCLGAGTHGGLTCTDSNGLKIDNGATIFYTIGSTRGGDDFGSFARTIAGSAPTTGTTGGMADVNGFAARADITTDSFFLRVWTDGDDYLLNNLWLGAETEVNGKLVTAGLDSTLLGTGSFAAVPLPATALLLGGGIMALGAARRFA